MEYPARLFTASKESKTFVAERSDFGPGELLGRIYPDACDAGLRIISPSGAIATFSIDESKTEKDADGDIIAEHLFPTPETLRKLPQLEGWSVTLLND